MNGRNKTIYSVLGILSIKPMSGYDIKKMIDLSIGHFWNESFGQLYPTLKKLEEEEFVTVSTEVIGEKKKKVYEITAVGRDALKKWLESSADTNQIRLESLLKIFFGFNVEAKKNLRHIYEMKIIYENELAELTRIKNEIESFQKNDDNFYSLLTVEYGIMNYKANLKWAEYAIEQIKKLEGEEKK